MGDDFRLENILNGHKWVDTSYQSTFADLSCKENFNEFVEQIGYDNKQLGSLSNYTIRYNSDMSNDRLNESFKYNSYSNHFDNSCNISDNIKINYHHHELPKQNPIYNNVLFSNTVDNRQEYPAERLVEYRMNENESILNNFQSHSKQLNTNLENLEEVKQELQTILQKDDVSKNIELLTYFNNNYMLIKALLES